MKLFEMHLERQQQHGSTHKTFLQNFDLLLFCFQCCSHVLPSNGVLSNILKLF